MPKIDAISITNFRGILGDFTLDLRKNGKATSAFLLGDNGCGKSSILDAIGFCLRGETVHYTEGRYGHPALRNFNTSTNSNSCFVTVRLDSGEEVTRNVKTPERGDFKEPPHDSFQYSRFTIRRRDLLEFTELSNSQRSSYLAGFGGVPRLAEKTSELQGVHNEIRQLTVRRRELEKLIVARTGSSPDHFPRTRLKLDEWVYRLRGGTARMTRAQRKKLPSLPPDLVGPIADLRHVDSSISKLRKHAHTLGSGRNEKTLNDQLSIVGQNVTTAFVKLCPQAALVKRFVFLAPEESSPVVSLRMDLPSGHNVAPRTVLSEASLDLLALLTLLYLIKAADPFGQGKVIVLDDVFSSIDSTVRNRIAEHLFAEFHNWQLILSFHDRLWFEQFRRAASSQRFDYLAYEFGAWRPASGPAIYQAPQDSSTNLRNAISSLTPDRMQIAGLAGLLVETMCDFLTLNLSVSLPRKLDQSYTIGEMWQPLSANLVRSSIAEYVSNLNGMIHLRNLGAHHNEWASNLSMVEVLDFADAALALWDHVYCPICRTYLRRKSGSLRCTCGNLSATLS